MKPALRSLRLSQSEPLQRCGWPVCGAACCYAGVWVDTTQANDIQNHSDLIAPHMSEGARDPRDWFDDRLEHDSHALSGQVRHTRVAAAPQHYMGTACIFLRADFKCALQIAAEDAGLGGWRFKPFYCILHPLDLDDHGRITLDDAQALADEPGSCLRSAESATRIDALFAEELTHLAGRPSPDSSPSKA